MISRMVVRLMGRTALRMAISFGRGNPPESPTGATNVGDRVLKRLFRACLNGPYGVFVQVAAGADRMVDKCARGRGGGRGLSGQAPTAAFARANSSSLTGSSQITVSSS